MSKIIDYIVLNKEIAGIEHLETTKSTQSDRTQTLVEQTLFAMYLVSVGVTNQYFDRLCSSCITHDSPTVRQLGLILTNLQKGVVTPNEQLDVDDVLFILNEPRLCACPITIDAKFIYQLLPLIGVAYHTDVYSDGIIYNPCLYTPNLTTIQGVQETEDGRSEQGYNVLEINSLVVGGQYSLSPFGDATGKYGLRLINQFTLENCTFERYVAMLAGFSIPSLQYSIDKNIELREYQTLCALCRDLVSESQYAKWADPTIKAKAINNFIQVIANKIGEGNMAQVVDCELFAELIRHDPYVSDLIKNYCIKPVSLITAKEAFAFRNSQFANVLKDRVLASMEALEGGESDTQEQAEDLDTTTEDVPVSSDSSFEEDNEDTPAEDTTLDSSVPEADAASQKNDDKPRIDPGMMLLELSNPSETMSDYMYRSIVSRRISALLKNPPENAAQDDLLMLKRWRSRWLYIVSVPCIREFLSRLAIRLSD